MLLNEIRRSGEKLIKHKLPNVAKEYKGEKHAFLYKSGKLYYSFIMIGGVLVDINEKEIKSENIKGVKSPARHTREWYNSGLNEWYNHKTPHFYPVWWRR